MAERVFFVDTDSTLSYIAEIARAGIAQSVEQGTENPRVGGSIPPPGMSCMRSRPKGADSFLSLGFPEKTRGRFC